MPMSLTLLQSSQCQKANQAWTAKLGGELNATHDLQINVNSEYSWVFVKACVSNCSLTTFDFANSTTNYIPSTGEIVMLSTGSRNETDNGTAGADQIYYNNTWESTNVSVPLEFNFVVNATPKVNQTTDVSLAGAIGLSFVSNFSKAWTPNPAPKSATTKPLENATSSFIDTFINSINTTLYPAKRVIAIDVNNVNGGSIHLGGVNNYNSSDNHTNCTVTTTDMICALGGVVITDAPSNTLAVEHDSNALSYFLTNNTSNNTFKYDTTSQYIVAPNSTFDWFNSTFGLHDCNLVQADPYANVNSVLCLTAKNDLSKNTKSIYFVGTDRKGMSIKAADLVATGNMFKIRFNLDNTTTTWTLGTDFLNSHTVILDYDQKTVTVTGGDVFAFIGTGTGSSKTVYIIVGIAVAVAAIAIAIVIYCCCCKKNEGDDYREQK